MKSNNFFKIILGCTLGVLFLLAIGNFVASVYKGSLVEKHIFYRNNEVLTTANQQEISDPTRLVANMEVIYKFDGIIYFLGMIICLVLLYLILSPLKYEYHEFVHDEWLADFNNKVKDFSRNMTDFNNKIEDIYSKIKEINEKMEKYKNE